MTLPHCPEHHLEFLVCSHCGSEFLAPVGVLNSNHCLSCKGQTGDGTSRIPRPAMEFRLARYNRIMEDRALQEAALRAAQEMNNPPEN